MSHLRESILAWLEEERIDLSAWAEAKQHPQTIPVYIPILTPHPDGSLSGENILREVSPLNLPTFRAFYEKDRAEPESMQRLAEELLNYYGDACDGFSPSTRPFQQDRVGWVRKALLESTRRRYLEKLSTLNKADERLSGAAADALLAYLEAREVLNVDSVAVGGIGIEGNRLEVGNAVVRRLSPEEIGAVAEPHKPAVAFGEGKLLHFGGTVNERMALEIRTPCAKNVQPRSNALRKCILALQLLGFEPHGTGLVANWVEPMMLGGWAMSYQIKLPEYATTKTLSEASLAEALELASRLPEDARQPKSLLEVALHRFALGAAEDAAHDALVDYVTALEALLLQGERQELGFRFALTGAWLAADDPATRHSAYQDLNKIYKARSIVAHGLKLPSEKEVWESAVLARSLAGQLLTRVLRQGWPERDNLLKLVLGLPQRA